MRGRILIVTGFFVLFLAACKTVDKLTQFNMGFKSSVVLPAPTGIDLPSNISTPDVTTNSETTFSIEDTRKDMIERVKLSSLLLSITSPSNASFRFMKTINVFMSAEGVPEIKVAWKENIPDTAGNNLQLETSDADLKEYLKKDKIILRLNTVTDELITSDHHIDILSLFFVDAKILGQ